MIDHFDLIAPIYDLAMGSGHPKMLQRVLKLPTNGWILDAGGGTGRVSSYLTNLVEHVVVCDLSFKMLLQAKRKSDLMPIRSHAEQLPFEANTFDRILVVDALHHFCDPYKSLQDLIRVLKPGGRLLVEEPDIRSFPVKVIALAERLLGMNSRFFLPETLLSMVSTPGITSIVKKGPAFRFWMIIDKP
jgi:demethylmenaquinone methyltransferase/2-methoxy-6-polyprenyl-1,4-benzoquinol methylase